MLFFLFACNLFIEKPVTKISLGTPDNYTEITLHENLHYHMSLETISTKFTQKRLNTLIESTENLLERNELTDLEKLIAALEYYLDEKTYRFVGTMEKISDEIYHIQNGKLRKQNNQGRWETFGEPKWKPANPHITVKTDNLPWEIGKTYTVILGLNQCGIGSTFLCIPTLKEKLEQLRVGFIMKDYRKISQELTNANDWGEKFSNAATEAEAKIEQLTKLTDELRKEKNDAEENAKTERQIRLELQTENAQLKSRSRSDSRSRSSESRRADSVERKNKDLAQQFAEERAKNAELQARLTKLLNPQLAQEADRSRPRNKSANSRRGVSLNPNITTRHFNSEEEPKPAPSVQPKTALTPGRVEKTSSEDGTERNVLNPIIASANEKINTEPLSKEAVRIRDGLGNLAIDTLDDETVIQITRYASEIDAVAFSFCNKDKQSLFVSLFDVMERVNKLLAKTGSPFQDEDRTLLIQIGEKLISEIWPALNDADRETAKKYLELYKALVDATEVVNKLCRGLEGLVIPSLTKDNFFCWRNIEIIHEKFLDVIEINAKFMNKDEKQKVYEKLSVLMCNIKKLNGLKNELCDEDRVRLLEVARLLTDIPNPQEYENWHIEHSRKAFLTRRWNEIQNEYSQVKSKEALLKVLNTWRNYIKGYKAYFPIEIFPFEKMDKFLTESEINDWIEKLY